HDLAGNPGTGTVTRTWAHDTLAPAAATQITFTPDTGIPGDQVTNALVGTVQGTLDEAGLIVEVFDVTAATTLGQTTASGTTFSIPVQFTAPGNHQLRIRARDAAGNSSDSFFNLFIDASPSAVQEFVGRPPTLTSPPPEFLDIVFTEPIEQASLDRA